METNVVRNAKFVKVIGIITTVLFLSVSIFLILTGNLLASLFFLPFAALGIILILAYEKEKILLEKESLTICRLFGKTQQVELSGDSMSAFDSTAQSHPHGPGG